MTARSGHTVLGLMLIVGGYALLFAALILGRSRSHDGDDHSHGATKGAVASACPCGSTDVVRPSFGAGTLGQPGADEARTERTERAALSAAFDGGTTIVDASALGNGDGKPTGLDGGFSRTARGGDGGAIDTDAAAGAWMRPGAVAQFTFLTGGAAMVRTELERLQAVAKVLAQYPDSRITVEGFPDGPGADARKSGIAAHRARVGQAILMQAGVPQGRISVTTPGLDQAGKLAHTVRMIVDPPVAEIETL